MLSTLTVPALKTLATDMGLTVPSKARKAEIIDMIAAGIEQAHDEAIAENRAREIKPIAAAAVSLIKNTTDPVVERMRKRVQSYMNHNGTDKLTVAQRRRIRKKQNKTGVNPYALSYVFP